MRMTHVAPLLAAALAFACVTPATAADEVPQGEWTGSGELGFAMTRGNTRSESVNAKLNLKREDETWKNAFYLTGLRNKGEVTVQQQVDGETVSTDVFQATANRIEAGASVGYRVSPRSYIVSALRYEHDDFATYRWQAALSVGFGYIAIKNPATELSFEAGPGYKRVQPVDVLVPRGEPPVPTWVSPDTEGEAIVRGLMNFRHAFNASTSIEDTLLVEAGSDGRFVQNDIGLVVKMNNKLALKVGHQTRYNSEVAFGTKHTDQLLTTNLVYSF